MDPTIVTILESIGAAIGAIIVTAISIFGGQLMAILRLRTAMKVAEMATKSIEQTNKNSPPEVKRQMASNLAQSLMAGIGLQNLAVVMPALNEAKVLDLPSTKSPAASGPTIDEIPRG